MGNSKSQKRRIIMCGCEGSGKSTILHKLNLGEVICTEPTVGFNMEILTYKNIELCSWDIGEDDTPYILMRNYMRGTSALIWVVNSNNISIINKSRNELHKYFLNDELLLNVPILIFVTKNDLPNSIDKITVQNKLGMTQTIKYSIDSLKSIQENTFLTLLTDKIMDIICQYSDGQYKCGPNLEGDRITNKVLSQKGMLTFEFLKGEKGLGWEDMKKIQKIICEYVPPYEHGVNGTQTMCKSFQCNGETGNGLVEGLQWLFNTLNLKINIDGSDAKKKDCVLL